ncbi:hypothetical protein QQS21_003144 [Conoideocrella luteorostrata]|uniref:N-acetyltransferase B complex non catalytic subunit-domain-containing protein n=1 Tax=Conoideocrella luteorostrata TaxID=1105319 RepID=A0AAJ0CTY3_9HYPO|nr:hypothetical protein QQS21_003144 [Conoideocrella luteorostrata]
MSSQRPRLRNGVDIQLQSAFQDGNWPVAMRLAQQRARTFNDQYYDIVKVCAESQLDDPNAKFAAVAAIDKFVKDGTVIKDVDAIDLLEWATEELIPEHVFPEKLGPLRVRAVKAAPKDSVAATRCLQSCLLHWDLNSAQQIAAMIDRSFAQERDFMFWNIAITHMLATSTQSPPDKKKLYAMLAQKQIERAAQLTEQARASESKDGTPTRGVKTEEEILLLYDIVGTHGTPDDMKKLVQSPVFSPVAQFRMGRKELFQRVTTGYRKNHDWEALCDLCHECLSHTGDGGQLSMLVCDWSVWKQFIEAAARLKSSNTKIATKVQELLLKLAQSKDLKPIYKRNVLLARVSAAFTLATNDQDDLKDGKPSSLRLRELLHYIEDQKSNIACFDDVKEFLEQVDVLGLKHVAYKHIPDLASAAEDPIVSARITLLSLKAQYFLSTCPISQTQLAGKTPRLKCLVCDAKFDSESCSSCLTKISATALEAYNATTEQFPESSVAKNEILPELSMVVAFCNVKLAFCSRRGYVPSPPILQYLLRALLILEHQVFLTPKHSQISLLLVQLHLFLGSAHRCREIWHELGIKRTIVDSVAPIFYDRLSTVAPAILDSSDNWGWELVETLRDHYAKALKLRMHRKLIDAFEAGSYGSIIDMPEYTENLRAGCTRAMSLVEEVRADRLLGEPCGEFLSDPRFHEVADDLQLRNIVDYGSFPLWSSSASAPLHERLSLGPALSNTRSHLSLLGEAFQDILSYRPPTVYKATAAVMGIDYTFVIEMMDRISNSMSKFLGMAASTHCTSSEMPYYESVHLLATLIPLCVSIDRSEPLPDILNDIIGAVRAAMTTLLDDLPKPSGTIDHTVSALRSFHQLTMLHDTAIASKLATAWILSFNEREKERDRSGSSSLPKEVVSQIKGLQASAEAALKEGKAVVGKLKSEIGNGVEFGVKLRQWVFEDSGEDLGKLVEDGTVKEVVESWRLNVVGWGQVKWE